MKILKTKNFEKISKLDLAIVSFPTQHNLTNVILASFIDSFKPELVARLIFDELPVTIVVNGKILSPSMDLYLKKIKSKNYGFLIGNYKPKDVEAYKKIYRLLKKSEEIIVLNELSKANDVFYFRHESEHKNKKNGKKVNVLKIEKLTQAFKKLDNAIIRGIPKMFFDLAEKNGKKVTMLFFNPNIESLESSIKCMTEALNLEIENSKLEKIRKYKDDFNQVKNKNKKFGYIG